MVGAILGDIIGSIYEFEPTKNKEFHLLSEFNQVTDDGLLTMAVFSALEKCNGDYKKLGIVTAKELIKWYANYPMPMGGYGSLFSKWATESLQSYKVLPAYNSFGNGAAMRISPVAYFASSLEECIELSRIVTEVTHNHPEGIKGAEAIAVTIYMALNGKNRSEIRDYIRKHYYSLNESCNEIRKYYQFEGSSQKTVPQSIQAFLESTCYEDAVRIAISLGGDADTMAAITGAIAEAYFGIPEKNEIQVNNYLDERCQKIVIRMIQKRNAIANRYLETTMTEYKEGFTHYRITGADMDGFPSNYQKNAYFKYNNVFYESRDGKYFVKTDVNKIETPMNHEDFQFFIDEIRIELYNKFKHEIVSVEDYYCDLFLEFSNYFWKE